MFHNPKTIFMKKIKLMFGTILTLSILAGVFAFKAKKINGYCIYQTTFTIVNHVEISACVFKGQYLTTQPPHGGIAKSIFTTLTECADISIFTEIAKCTLTRTLIIE